MTGSKTQKDTDQLAFLDDQYLLWILLNQTRASIFKAREKKVGKYYYPNQAAALIMVWACHGQATPSLLARYLFLERHSVSELITRMEENGLVSKSRDKKLKSVVRISVTSKGQEVCSRYTGSNFIHEMISTLTEEQQAQLRSCLQLLLDKACSILKTKSVLPPLP